MGIKLYTMATHTVCVNSLCGAVTRAIHLPLTEQATLIEIASDPIKKWDWLILSASTGDDKVEALYLYCL